MNLASLLHDAAAETPDAPALARGTRVTATYAQHADRSARLAGALRGELGLSTGDRVALAMKNDTAYSEIMFGAWHGGCAAVPMNARLHPREFAWILENSGSRVCFVSEELFDDIAEAARDVGSLEQLIVAGSGTHRSLYDARPMQCRTWPFWPENLTSRRVWEATKRRTPCPGMGQGPVVPIERIRIDRDATPSDDGAK